MVRIQVDSDKYGQPPASPLVEATLSQVQDLVRKKLRESGLSWNEFVAGGSDHLISKTDIAAIEARILASGHRFDWSASISVAERPEAYKPAADANVDDFSFEHPGAPVLEADAEGREQRGVGDNVVRYPANVVGTARYIRTNESVMNYLVGGVPAGTIAVIDDSGGTLTAPIIDQFAGVVCAGGTVRSHLGILTREYGIPCLMNVKLSGIKEGDRIEVEVTALARTTEDYQARIERPARVWRLAQGEQ